MNALRHAAARRSSSGASRPLLSLAVLALLLSMLAVPGSAQAADQLWFKSVNGEWAVTSGVADGDIGTVLARGVPKRYIRYSIEGADGFSIGRRSGRVSYDGTLISGEQVSLTVTARDKNGEAASASRVIEVSVTQPAPEPDDDEQESAPQEEQSAPQEEQSAPQEEQSAPQEEQSAPQEASVGPPGPPGDPQIVPSNWPLIPRDASGQPLFGPGRAFRLVFLTSGKRDALSSDIDDYNAFVQSHAAMNPHLQPFSGRVRALASTGFMYAATRNADTNGRRVPVYWLRGQRASYNQQNLFSMVWLPPCRVWDESGTPVAGDDALAWTEFLGPGIAAVGDASDVGAANCYPFGVLSGSRTRPADEEHRLYGLSPIFIVEEASVGLKMTPRVIGENGGASRITATLTAARDSDVTVRVSATPLSPAATTDFALSGSADLIIRAGETESENTLTLTAVDNTADAANKFISVSGALTPAVSGLQNPTEARLTILDDEVPGPPERTIPADSSLIPKDSEGDPLFSRGQSFRLLFNTGRGPSQARSYTKSAGEQEISWYDAEVQTDVAESRITAMRQYSGDFRALVCTAGVDARDNTQTTYTQGNQGVPIYWLKGSKVADDYAEFYGSGGWESFERRDHNGVERTTTVVTGCNSDGTAHESRHVGMPRMTYAISAEEPLMSARWTHSRLGRAGFFGLSPVFTVG